MEFIENLEIIDLKTVEGKLIATLSYQDVTNTEEINNGYGIIDIPINLRSIQKSVRGNVLVDQSVKSETASAEKTEQPELSNNETT